MTDKNFHNFAALKTNRSNHNQMPSGLLFGVEIAFSSYEREQQGCGANRTQQEDRAHRTKPHQSQMGVNQSANRGADRNADVERHGIERRSQIQRSRMRLSGNIHI